MSHRKNLEKEIDSHLFFYENSREGLKHLNQGSVPYILFKSDDINGYHLAFHDRSSQVRVRHFNVINNRSIRNCAIFNYINLNTFIQATLISSERHPLLSQELRETA